MGRRLLPASFQVAPRSRRPPGRHSRVNRSRLECGRWNGLLHLRGATPEQEQERSGSCAIFREEQLIVSLLLPFQPGGSPAERRRHQDLPPDKDN